ncbi:ATP-binding protein [Olsenella sp. YH-ols2217]|uniref:ATP-binding protein n=1 Tax=Kribbibacterium absianum TaxID=3044210 RepID=A0ABT6ZM51_9ACTN|nr:ATP-binding protein [Olsenella sp. YH-ols2217]MDJ1130133.1 ATP-binding protein [Olsenella sp. YH-ols2217]
MPDTEGKTVSLTVPAEAEFARSVRMLAANLAVVCGLSIDDVEDVRMAAEEGFVFSSSTDQDEVQVLFTIDEAKIQIQFSLGESAEVGDFEDGDFDYAKLILDSVTDEAVVDEEQGVLTVVKTMGGAA